MPSIGEALARARWPGSFRPYQERALDALAAGWAASRKRAWVVLPPGAGKTLVGLEAARRLGRKIVVLTPNTAIQGQWLGHWSAFQPPTVSAGTSRRLDADLTVLTYQSLAVFDPESEVDEDGRIRGTSLMGRLHPSGHALVDALRQAGPLTLILDECHHLLEVWGRLVAEVLDQLPEARVIGLTATPPQSLTAEQAKQVGVLFGAPLRGASIPALVRQSYLAPFAELAWLTPPTASEAGFIAADAERFAELTTDLADPAFGFLTWLDMRFVTRDGPEPMSWQELERREPALSAAVLRFHYAGLLGLPGGARLREEHRHQPTADDWIALVDDFTRHRLLPSDEPGDAEALEAIRRALPSAGFQLTRRGIRAAPSPVDRVLARSAAKTYAAVEIAAAEADSLGDRLRCLVLCDYERAGAQLPARLREVLGTESGSAWLMLKALLADPRTRLLAPMLVTGQTVAAAEETAGAFTARHRGLTWEKRDGAAVITGSWSPRTWVPLVTSYFESGESRLLVGTRALLGEGWDARRLNTLIDATTATTPTSVVQTRGRAIRLDERWPDKTANTWSVVAVSDQHPKGSADWRRFVRKHEGYLAATAQGEIVSGVAHVDAAFSPYAPPPAADIDKINVRMVERAADRAAARADWRIGSAFRDELVQTIRVRPAARQRRPLPLPVPAGRPVPPAAVPAADGIAPAPPGSLPPRAISVAGASVVVALWLLAGWRMRSGELVLALVASIAFALRAAWTARRLRRAGTAVEAAAGEPPLLRFGYAVADALAALGRGDGAGTVTADAEPDGSYGFSLRGADVATAESFAVALDEVLSPIATPRYMMPRYILRPGSGAAPRRSRWALGRDLLSGSLVADGVVYHAVPAVFAANREKAHVFAAAWNRWVSAGEPVRSSTPEGEGILATHRGEDPFAVTTVLRVAWS